MLEDEIFGHKANGGGQTVALGHSYSHKDLIVANRNFDMFVTECGSKMVLECEKQP